MNNVGQNQIDPVQPLWCRMFGRPSSQTILSARASALAVDFPDLRTAKSSGAAQVFHFIDRLNVVVFQDGKHNRHGTPLVAEF